MNTIVKHALRVSGAALALSLGTATSAHANTWAMQTSGFQDRSALSATIKYLAEQNIDIDEMARTESGEWIVVAGQAVYRSGGFPASIENKVRDFVNAGKTCDVVAIAPDGNWVVVAENLWWRTNGVPQLLREKIHQRLSGGHRITELAFDTDGNGWSLISGNWAHTWNAPSGLYTAVVERHKSGRKIKQISIGDDGKWVLLADDWFASKDINPICVNWIKIRQRQEHSLDRIILGPGNAWILFTNGHYNPDPSVGLNTVEYTLGDGNDNIWERMEETNVRGISIAVIEDNQVKYARGYGVTENDTQYYVKADTPFDTASLSKFVASFGIMNVVGDRRVNLGLDSNIAQVAWDSFFQNGSWSDLAVWMIWGPYFNNEILPAGDITLRRVLSHSASLEPWGSTSYQPDSPTPALWEMLLGENCNGDNCTYGGGNMVWYNPDIKDDGGEYPPGTAYRYSGGGFMVGQAMAEAVTDTDFATLVDQRIFSPLGLDDCSFVAPLPPSMLTRSAKPHYTNGNVVPASSQPYYPWAAAGGLFSSASDLARVMIAINQFGVGENGTRVVSSSLVEQMLTKQAAQGVRYGFGLSLSSNQVTANNGAWYGHNGSHSYAKSRMGGNPTREEGIVVLVNGGGDEAAELRDEIYNRFKAVYGW